MRDSDIKYKMKCTTCSGTGKVERSLSLTRLLELLDESNGTENKINYIKAVRAEWLLGLREAKELSEVALRFREQSVKVLGVYINGITEVGEQRKFS